MNPIEMKMMMRLMKTLNEARKESLLRDRKGIELARPIQAQMTMDFTKQRLPCGAVSWVIPWALAMLLEPVDWPMGQYCAFVMQREQTDRQ